VDWVHVPMDHERRQPMVDHGHRPGGDSPEIGRNGVPVRRTSLRLRKIISELKIRFLNLARLWKFVEGDLGGILT
jgi:hypothetical protein